MSMTAPNNNPTPPTTPAGKAPYTTLIVGCGYVGTELGLQLAAAGHRVIGLRRNAHTLPAPIEPLPCDLTAPTALTAALATIQPPPDFVVYAAAADGSDLESYRRAYLEGVENTLTALAALEISPRRFVFTSSTSVFSEDGGGTVNEASPAEPTSPTGQLLREGEKRVAAAPFPATTVRLSGIYGPGRTRMTDLVRAGQARLPAHPPQWTNRIHRDDAAGAIAHLLARTTRGEPVDPLYIVSDCEPVDRGVFYTWLARKLGVPPPTETEDETPTSRRQRGGNKCCDSLRIRQTGYVFRFPTYRAGYGGV